MGLKTSGVDAYIPRAWTPEAGGNIKAWTKKRGVSFR